MNEKYPLEQLSKIKQKRFEQAIKKLEEKTAILKKEETKLAKTIEEKHKVIKHKEEKIKQLDDLLDQGTTSDKIQQAKIYLETVAEKLIQKEKKVADQQKKVDTAGKEVDLARAEMYDRNKDIEKLKIHKHEWQKTMKLQEEREEAKLQDELGSSRFTMRSKKKK